MRLVADIATTIIAMSTVIGILLRRLNHRRREQNLDAIKRMEKENQEIDQILERMKEPK